MQRIFMKEKLRKKRIKYMPLLKGKKAKTKKGIAENIKREKTVHPEMPTKQAVAIAYSVAKKKKK